VSDAKDDRVGMVAGDAPERRARLEVVGGGTPTPEQLAAVVLALTPTAAADGERPNERPTVPAWTAAALAEGVGGPRVVLPADLTAPGPRG
jgi:hypothetical protein